MFFRVLFQVHVEVNGDNLVIGVNLHQSATLPLSAAADDATATIFEVTAAAVTVTVTVTATATVTVTVTATATVAVNVCMDVQVFNFNLRFYSNYHM